MFRLPTLLSAAFVAHAAPLLLTGAGLVFAPAVAGQQLGRTWHLEPAQTIQMGPIFDATSQVGLATSGTLKVANWAFFLENQTVHHYHDGPWRFMYHWVDRVGNLRMSVVRTQSGTAVPANFVAVDLDFMGQRILTRRSSAAGPGSIAYESLLTVRRIRETSNSWSPANITNTWTGMFEVRATGSWNLSPTAVQFGASAEARIRQGYEYFWGSNRNILGIGETREIWGGYSPVTMRANVSVASVAAGSSQLWADGCELRVRDRIYAIFQIPVDENFFRTWFHSRFETMM
ncbi:MAG: hypothetical protein R3F56_23500 [Planctomycetota bacterium]